MKKAGLLLSAFLVIVVLFSSCDKKDDNNNNNVEKFSTKSVEVNKASVEDAGIELVSTMKDMESLQTIDVVSNLGNIASSSKKKVSVIAPESKIMSTLDAVVAAAKGEGKLNNVFGKMASPGELADDPESIQEFWDENVGTYTWNSSLEDWDIDNGGDKFIFLFPSQEGSTINDATITISNYSGIVVSNPIDEEYTGDLPTSVNAELKVGNTVLVTFTFGASYNNDGVPNSVAADLTIESFKFELDLSNTTSIVSANYKLSQSGNTIIDMGVEGKGLFTDANLEDNTSTVTHSETYGYWTWEWNPDTQQYEEVWVEYTDTWTEEEVEFEEILHSASAHFQLFDLAIRGEVDVKGLADQIRIIEDDLDNEVISEDTAYSREAANINKYLNLRLVNVKTNEILAKVEAYVARESNEEYEDVYVNFRLTFGDGSPIDVETYFTEGFDGFVDELNGLINDINNDYDIGLEPVEY